MAFTESKINSLGYTDFTEWTNYLPSLCPFIPDSSLAMQLKSGRLFLLYGNAHAGHVDSRHRFQRTRIELRRGCDQILKMIPRGGFIGSDLDMTFGFSRTFEEFVRVW